jgi:hypothetical protein
LQRSLKPVINNIHRLVQGAILHVRLLTQRFPGNPSR